MPAKHLECSIRSVVWHGPVVTPDTPRRTHTTLAWDGCLCAPRIILTCFANPKIVA
jgi:hypothetical protein